MNWMVAITPQDAAVNFLSIQVFASNGLQGIMASPSHPLYKSHANDFCQHTSNFYQIGKDILENEFAAVLYFY